MVIKGAKMTYTHTQIMTIAKDETQAAEDNLSKLLDIGLQELNLTLGIVSQIIGDSYTVVHTNNPELLGQQFPLGTTYCSITMSLVAKRIFAVKHFSVSDHFRHPAYKAFQLETYIGSPIMVNKRQFGTLNFTKPTPRTEDFTKEDKELVKSLSQAISYILETQPQTLEYALL